MTAKVDSTTLRRCTKCGDEYPATAEYFYSHKKGKNGLSSACKDCMRSMSRKWKDDNHEHVLEYSRVWRQDHPEQRRETWDCWYAENQLEVCENARQRRVTNPIPRDYSKERHNTLNRLSRKRNAEGTHTAADIAAQYKRQKGRCYYAACGHCKLGNKYHVDHVVPLSRGGRNAPDNLVITCVFCNESKGAKLPHEWTQGRRLL